MTRTREQLYIFFQHPLRLLIIILLILGIFFRFTNIDRKVYWMDETFTSLWFSGYSDTEIEREVTGRIVNPEDLQKYQRLNPDRSVFELIEHPPQLDALHPPLYYALTRLWVGWFGDSVATIRTASVLMSLFALPCAYSLGLKLFDSSLTGGLFAALFAVSPFHVLYAQEAREYALWTVTILLSSAALLQALRCNTKLSWGFYTLTIVMGLYTYLLHCLVLFAQGIYVLITERFRCNTKSISCLVSSFVGSLVLLPWLLNIQELSSPKWTESEIDILVLLKILALNFIRVFFDIDFDSSNPLIYLAFSAIAVLVCYAIYFSIARTPPRIWLFILLLIGTTGLFILLQDLLMGGRRSIGARYFIPCYLGVQLSVAYLFASQIGAANATTLKQRFWQLALVLLFSVSLLSCAVSSQAQTWWNKYYNQDTPPIAEVVNQAPHGLIIANFSLLDILSLSYFLDSKIRIQFLVNSELPQEIPDDFSDLFLLNPSRYLRRKFNQSGGYKLERIYDGAFQELWRLKPKSVTSY
jgi:uncharacterized membrane protein